MHGAAAGREVSLRNAKESATTTSTSSTPSPLPGPPHTQTNTAGSWRRSGGVETTVLVKSYRWNNSSSTLWRRLLEMQRERGR